MRAPGAQHRRAWQNGNVFAEVGRHRCPGKPRRDHIGAQFTDVREPLFPDHIADAEARQLLLDEALALLDHEHGLESPAELHEPAARQGVEHPQSEDRCVRSHFLHVLKRDTVRHDANLGVSFLDDVALELLGELPEPRQLLLQLDSPEPRVHRDGVLAHSTRERLPLRFLSLTELDAPARVCESSGRAQHDRRAIPLAQLKGQRGEASRFGSVTGLQDRNLCHLREIPAVLLVLRGVHPRIVGHERNEAGVGAGVGEHHEGIGGHVEADVLHRHHAARPTEGRTHRLLERHLFVRRPVGVDLLVIREPLQHLGARRAGIAGGEDHAGLPRAVGHRLVTRQESHDFPPCP